MTLAEPVFMAFAVFSSVDECKAFAKYYDLARIFEPQCVEMGGEAEYRRPWPDVRPKPRPEQALLELKRRAERAIAHEVFGELEGDLLELRKMLWEEDFYRDSQDPVLSLLHGIIDKVRGETK